jgi:proline dehydrogenase
MNTTTLENFLNAGSAALRKAALSEEAKAYILADPVLFKTLKKAADRYIGGETLKETIGKVQAHNSAGFKCSIEFMGESSRTEIIADAATAEFIRICCAIGDFSLNSTVSLDLSHIGLAISSELCLKNLTEICAAAATRNIEVIISAEDTKRTDAVMDAYQAISRIHKNVGITLQAYLHRTKNDFSELIRLPGRIRIVKGAFETRPGEALPRGEQLDLVYLGYIEQLLKSEHLCAIATHDKNLQHRAKELIQRYQSGTHLFEFESLYGIQTDEIEALRKEGYPTKIYFVYGKEWYLYLCNRIAEYPLNIFRALSDIVE